VKHNDYHYVSQEDNMIERLNLEDLVKDDSEPTELDMMSVGFESVEFFMDHPEKALITDVSMESLMGNKKDDAAPDTTKCRITVLGLGFKAKFNDGEEVPADADSMFKSKHMQAKIKEFDDYYIKKLGYRAFTKQDESKLKMDAAQVLRKIYQFNVINKVGFKFIDGAGIYGLWNWALGSLGDKIRGSNDTVQGVDKSVISMVLSNLITGGFNIINAAAKGALNASAQSVGSLATSISTGKSNNSILSAPYCITYVKPGENGQPDKVFVRRILVVGFWTSSISKLQAKYGSGGKDIGTLSK
jgi:hypothetical protein